MTIFSRAVDDLISLPALLLVLGTGVYFLWRRPTARWPRAYLTAALAFYTVLSIPIVPYGGALLLGYKYRPLTVGPGGDISAVVLLGAGVETVEGGDHQQLPLLDTVGANRTLEASRVYRMLNRPWVISSGGSRSSERASSAATMADALVRLGVPADRILQERRSLTTSDEGELIAPMLRQLHAERFVLVTTRSHMRRSEAVFRAQHLDPVPAIVPDRIEPGRLLSFLVPDVDGLRLSRALFHECVGLIYYRLRGVI
jgi:uncharacterized SAM-binding protein YcdF (DUF218 family)